MQSVLQNLPVGWGFNPTDEQLIDHYLKNKRTGRPISGSDIQDIQISDFDPWDLIDSSSKERFFFYRHQIYYLRSGGCRTNRKGKTGHWRRTGECQSITREDSDEVIGTKKILVYHVSEDTEYVKHEYELTEELESPVQDGNDFVLCKLMINKKKKASKKRKEVGPLSEKEVTVLSDQTEVNIKKKAKKSIKSRKYLTDAASVSVSNKQKQPCMVANLAYDDSEPNNHATSDFELQNRSNERAHQAFGEGEASNLQNSILVTASSTWEKGESSHQGDYGFEDQNRYEMSNTSICGQDITNFLMELDFNQTSEETSFIMESDFEQNYLEISNLSGYSMSETNSQMMAYLENQNPNDSTTISLHKRSSNLFENQSLKQITIVSSLENENSDHSLGRLLTRFESGQKKTEIPNLEDLGEFAFPDINSPMLEELLCFDDLVDTFSSEPEPIHPPQEPRNEH